LGDELYKLQPDAFIAKVIPEHINNINIGDFNFSLEQILHFIERDPLLAKKLIKEIDAEIIGNKGIQKLGEELNRLESEAYRTKIVSEYIKELNKSYKNENLAKLSIHFLKIDNDLALRFIEEIDFDLIDNKNESTLRENLFLLQPEAYMSKAIPHYINNINKEENLVYSSEQLTLFLDSNPKLAMKFIHEIDSEKLVNKELLNLRDKLKALQPDAFETKVRAKKTNKGNDFRHKNTLSALWEWGKKLISR